MEFSVQTRNYQVLVLNYQTIIIAFVSKHDWGKSRNLDPLFTPEGGWELGDKSLLFGTRSILLTFVHSSPLHTWTPRFWWAYNTWMVDFARKLVVVVVPYGTVWNHMERLLQQALTQSLELPHEGHLNFVESRSSSLVGPKPIGLSQILLCVVPFSLDIRLTLNCQPLYTYSNYWEEVEDWSTSH